MKLKVQKRDTDTKPKNLRKEGLVPAEIYGKGYDNIHVSVEEKKFDKALNQAGMTQIINLQTEEDGKDIPALIYDVQYHPLSRKPLAIDFYRIREDEKLEITIPLEFTGSAPIEKEDFTVVKVLDEVEVEALPADIPESIEVNLDDITDEDDIIHLSDLQVSDEVEIKGDPDTVVVSVTEIEEEEEEEATPLMPGELGELGEEGEAPLEEGEAPLEEEEPLEETPQQEEEEV